MPSEAYFPPEQRLSTGLGGGTAAPGPSRPTTGQGGEKDAQERWETYVAPEVVRLETEITRHQGTVDQLTARRERQTAAARFSVERRWSLQSDVHRLAVRLDSHRDKLDGIPS